MIQNGHTYLNKSAAFAANLSQQEHPFSTSEDQKVNGIFRNIERELVNSFIKNSLLRFSV